jgi:hypothetical protein
MSDKYEALKAQLEEMEKDVEKFYVKGQSAAGTRLRKQLNELKKIAQEMRVEIQAIKADRKG